MGIIRSHEKSSLLKLDSRKQYKNAAKCKLALNKVAVENLFLSDFLLAFKLIRGNSMVNFFT